MARSSDLVRSEFDQEILRFASLHGVVTMVQAQVLLSAGQDAAVGALGRLEHSGLLRRERLGDRGPVLFKVSAAGLARTGGDLRGAGREVWVPRDVWLGWLWLAASQGHLGATGLVLTGRELRALDTRPENADGVHRARAAIGLADRPAGFSVKRAHGTVLHYPDLAVVDQQGWTIVELVLAAWPISLRGMVLPAYSSDQRVRRLVLAVREPAMALPIMLSPSGAGLRDRLQIYPVRLSGDLVLTPLQ